MSARYERADNDYTYRDDRGTLSPDDDRTARRDNADFRARDAWAVGRTTLSRGATVVTVLNAFEREQGLTGLSLVPARAARARTGRVLAGVTARVPCARDCRLELATSGIVARSRINDPFRELSLGATEVASRGTRIAQDVGVRWQAMHTLRLSARVGQEREHLRQWRRQAGSLRTHRDVSRASAHGAWDALDALTVSAVTALERHATTGPSEPAERVEPSARLGAELRMTPQLSLLASGSRGARVPTLGELYGVSAVVFGNPALKPEHAWSVDLGARAHARPLRRVALSGELFGFSRWSSDQIVFRRSGVGAVRPFNVATSRTLGLEAAAAADGWSHVLVTASATLLDPRDTTESRQEVNDLLPFQPRLSSSARLELYATRPLDALDRVALGASSHYRASTVADPAGLIIVPEQHQLDTDLSFWFWQRALALRAAVENVLDARRTDTVGLPLAGRSFYASAELVIR
jgi:iron complex outermembrane receptor protein